MELEKQKLHYFIKGKYNQTGKRFSNKNMKKI